jgi:chromosome segregation ATPase
MDQSLFDGMMPGLAAMSSAGVEDEVQALSARVIEMEDSVAGLPAQLKRLETAQARMREETERAQTAVTTRQMEALDTLHAAALETQRKARQAVWLACGAGVLAALSALAALL